MCYLELYPSKIPWTTHAEERQREWRELKVPLVSPHNREEVAGASPLSRTIPGYPSGTRVAKSPRRPAAHPVTRTGEGPAQQVYRTVC